VREPRVRIRTAAGVVYDVRLDHLILGEAYSLRYCGVLPPPEFTIELVEGPRGEKVVASETYRQADFPLASDD